MDYGVLRANSSEKELWVDFITTTEDIIFYQQQQPEVLSHHPPRPEKKKDMVLFHTITQNIKSWIQNADVLDGR